MNLNLQFINKTCLLLRLPEHDPADDPVLLNYVGPLSVPGRGDKVTHEGVTYIVTGREFHTSAVDGVADVILDLAHV